MSRGAIERYPAELTPLDEDGKPAGPDVTVFQLRPAEQEALIEWSGLAGVLLADAGVLLLDRGTVVVRLALGDFLIRNKDRLRVERDAYRLLATHRQRIGPTRD